MCRRLSRESAEGAGGVQDRARPRLGKPAGCVFCAVARFFRPGYNANIVDKWLPSLEGVVERLERGARVADVGCGHGYSTVMMMVEAFSNSEFIGFDFHAASIEEARRHAREHGLTDNVRFEVATAKQYPGDDYDLVTTFDCVHDMGDPVGAAHPPLAEARRHLDDRRAVRAR